MTALDAHSTSHLYSIRQHIALAISFGDCEMEKSQLNQCFLSEKGIALLEAAVELGIVLTPRAKTPTRLAEQLKGSDYCWTH